VGEARSVVESGSVAYSNITAAPHEYFHHKRYSGPDHQRGRSPYYSICAQADLL